MSRWGASARTRFWVGLVFVVSASMIAFVGSGAAASGTSGANAPGVSAKTITLGMIESQTGPASSTFDDSNTGAQARIDLQNAEGGVDGRQIKLDVVDDTSTATGNLLAAQDLVSTKNVFGVLNDDAVGVGSANYLLAQGVPATETPSNVTVDEPKYSDQFTYEQEELPIPPTTGLSNVFKTLGVTRVALLDYSDPQDSTAFPVEEKGIEATKGLSICYGSDAIPIGSVNFTALVLALKNANCQAVDFPAVESSDIAIAIAIQQAGLHIPQIYETGYDETFLDDQSVVAAAQGDLFSMDVPGIDLPTTAVSTFYAALKKYDPAYKGGIATFGAQTGWALADEFIEGLKLAGASPTRASFIKNLATDKDYTIGGINTSAVNLADRWHLVGPQCAYYVKLKGSKFVPYPSDDKPICGKILSGS